MNSTKNDKSRRGSSAPGTRPPRFRLLPLLGLLLATGACSADANDGDDSSGPGGPGGRQPVETFDDALAGSSERNVATLVSRSASLGELETSFEGEYRSEAGGASYVQCSLSEGSERNLLVRVGKVGAPPVVQLTIRDIEALSPFTDRYNYTAGERPPRIEFVARLLDDSGKHHAYELGALPKSQRSSYCWFELFEFDQLSVAGTVACRDLVPSPAPQTADESALATASLNFVCGLAAEDPAGSGGGSAQEPECSDGEERTCFGLEDGCEGVQTCENSVYSDCVCPAQPSVLLKLLFPSAQYESSIRQTSGSGLASTTSNLGADGYVVTAGMANTAPYTLVGIREQGSTRKFETIIRQTNGNGLSSTLNSMAADGYVVTVGMANDVPYTLIGVREVGSTKKYEATMRQTNGNGLSAAAAALGADGYVITTAMANSVPYTLIGVREVGTDKIYETTVRQTDGNGLSSAASDMASKGYVLTAATANTVPYTLFGVRDASVNYQLSGVMRQTSGSGLSATAASMTGQGHIIMAGTANTVPYTLFGTTVTVSPD